MAAVTPEWLQYGAFGLLFIVLVVIGKYIRDRDKFMETMVRNNTKRLDEIMANAIKREDSHIAAWREMMLMAIRAQKDTTEVLKELCTTIEMHDDRQDSRYSEIKSRLRSNPLGGP